MLTHVTIDGAQFEALIEAGVVTLDPKKAEKCCGGERDKAGRCQHRDYHPIYIKILRAYVG